MKLASKSWLLAASLLGAAANVSADTVDQAAYSDTPVTIDGQANESVWQRQTWHQMTHVMVGEKPTKEDFQGRYKVAWDNNKLYILAEIVDDVLIDTHPDPTERYWDDDCLEIFIDENASGGNHLINHNAFAYHIALDGNVLDMGNTEAGEPEFIILNEHVDSRWRRKTDGSNTMVWEVSIQLYPDTFSVADPGKPLSLSAGKLMGFMIAYCDNDGSKEREHFVGSHAIKPVNGDMNRGFIDASVFGKVKLVN